jgi:hypothetical protein
MPNAAQTFKKLFKSSSKLEISLAVGLALLLSSAWSFAQSSQGSLCQPDEGVLFSCQLEGNRKVVSLCTGPEAAPFQSITYRYGTASRNELTYSATADNHNRFVGTVSPVGPNASIRQVWFETKGVKYIATTCVGGDCPHRGGLIVFRGTQLLMSRACTDDSSQPWFSSKVVRFGSDLESSHTNTDLIQLQDYDNNVNVLYPWKQLQ